MSHVRRFGGVALQRVRVELAAAARAGAVGACLAPVYTLRASLRPWLRRGPAGRGAPPGTLPGV